MNPISLHRHPQQQQGGKKLINSWVKHNHPGITSLEKDSISLPLGQSTQEGVAFLSPKSSSLNRDNSHESKQDNPQGFLLGCDFKL
jgi:hypothetical protein